MRLAILTSSESWYFRDLCRAAPPADEIIAVPFSRLSSSIEAVKLSVTTNEWNLGQFDAVLVRTMPPGSLEQVVLRMDLLGALESQGCPVVNSPKSLEVAVDKYLASLQLMAAGLRVPRTVVCQSWDEAMRAFGQLGGDVVVKPLFGGEGRGIARVNDEAMAVRAFKMLGQLNSVIYLQEFLPHEGFDLRLFVIGSQVLGMKRVNTDDWRTNVALGARSEKLEVTDQLADIARRSAASVGASVAGVDVLPARDGNLYVLEVNAVPGWKSLAKTVNTDVGALVLEHVRSLVGRS
ncbi:MAG: 30S ribosomal protein S6--L-glutamate ligase [Planctomycetaceae bacterium]|nr:30S ribosomal protein S6--L-glutamate ligase [Planctomycetaceae bacterium]MBP60194.1 30S ribosomal protein S6--L-glutamate ligase [Planctomycetaceae bacterium]